MFVKVWLIFSSEFETFVNVKSDRGFKTKKPSVTWEGVNNYLPKDFVTQV